MPFHRVLPRDLFNESKLLKCLGRLCLLSHDELIPVWFEHDTEQHTGFHVVQDASSGDLYCTNLTFGIRGEVLEVVTRYNDRSNYPLLFWANDDDGFLSVFDDDGNTTADFDEFCRKLGVRVEKKIGIVKNRLNPVKFAPNLFAEQVIYVTSKD